MTIGLVFITYNRLDYTKLALPALLGDLTEEFSLTIWDNASTDGTQEFLSSVDDPRIVEKVFNKENMGLRGAINHLFSNSAADLVGIIPNDLLVTPGWTRPIARAHADVPEFGLIGCWHLGKEYFDESRAKHKIQKFGDHRVLRHPWTGGAGGLVKLKAVRECGMLQSNATPDYWKRMALKGYVNGFYYPLVYVEHMDDLWSEHYAFSGRLQEGVQMSVTYSNRRIRTLEDAKAWHQVVVNNALDDPWEVKYYVGWRKKLRNVRKRLHI
ncbi:MAG: glycosyltransferase family 2 protein [Planctomycetes bacterium]|nr:glycosyltransferase family 2 protein [Planctomycetota bacterium]